MYRIKDRTFIGAKIRIRRKELALSQAKVAEAIDTSYQQVQRYENGKSSLSTEKLQAICNALDVPVTYFFEADGKENINIMDRANLYLSPEELEFVKYLRKIDNADYRKSIMTFLRLAAEKKNHKR